MTLSNFIQGSYIANFAEKCLITRCCATYLSFPYIYIYIYPIYSPKYLLHYNYKVSKPTHQKNNNFSPSTYVLHVPFSHENCITGSPPHVIDDSMLLQPHITSSNVFVIQKVRVGSELLKSTYIYI